MNNHNRTWRTLFFSDDGATSTEYAVMIALILAVAFATIVYLGEKVEEGFNEMATLADEHIK